MTEDAPNRPGDRPETLSTERLILRPPSPADASGVLEVHRHPCVAAGVISVPHPCPPDHGETWIAKITAAMEETALRVWLIEDRASGRVIGDCGLDADETHRRGSIGYILHPDHRGRGLMTEALGAVLRLLRGGERTVGELTDALPVTQGAVSQHLRILRDAHLVTVRPAGTRNLYSVDLDGLAEVRAWVDSFWDDVLSAFVEHAESPTEES